MELITQEAMHPGGHFCGLTHEALSTSVHGAWRCHYSTCMAKQANATEVILHPNDSIIQTVNQGMKRNTSAAEDGTMHRARVRLFRK